MNIKYIFKLPEYLILLREILQEYWILLILCEILIRTRSIKMEVKFKPTCPSFPNRGALYISKATRNVSNDDRVN